MEIWHHFSEEEILEKTKVIDFISLEERQSRQKISGKNILEKIERRPEWLKFISYFHDILMYALIAASGLKFIIGAHLESIIILLVVFLNALIGYYQERKASSAMSGIANLLSKEAIIVQSNEKYTIQSSELVIGDKVFLSPGNIVPADLRMVEVFNLEIDESILTGETHPVIKSVECLDVEVPLAERINMAYSGTMVQQGSGVGIVIAIGKKTEVGKISESLEQIENQETPLLKKVNEMNHSIFKGIGILIVVLGLVSYFVYDMTWTYIAAATIALIVSSIPEGLPSILTIILSGGVYRMAQKNAIVKTLPTVETLGAMTVICSDKTGTLTENEMTLDRIFLQGQITTPQNFVGQNIHLTNGGEKLLQIMQNCQETQLKKQDGCPISGNATEIALLRWTNTIDVEFSAAVKKIPFDSKYKYMVSIHTIGNEQFLFVKGAPDVLIKQASYEYDTYVEKKELNRLEWEQVNHNFADSGQRVIAFAYKKWSILEELDHNSLDEGLILVGLAGIMDPPKESAIKAVQECQNAGVQVKMITGDHPITAKAIAKNLGLNNIENAYTGDQLDTLNEEEWKEVVSKTDIFARTTPAHKLAIVSYLQEQGEIVGMTGDGVNDAPALKKADIGIAMGIKGSDVSKQAADMVLVDDNFETISEAIREGRRIFDNLKKTILFYLPTCLAQGLLVIVAMIGNLPIPLTTVQILWLNMVASITLSYALGFEGPHKNIMKRNPRNIDEKIISKYVLFRIVYVAMLITLFGYLAMNLFTQESIRQTVLINAIVFGQALYMINCREFVDFSLSKGILANKALVYSLVTMVGLQLIMIYIPVASILLGTVKLTLSQFIVSIIPAIALFGFVELEKRATKFLLIRSK